LMSFFMTFALLGEAALLANRARCHRTWFVRNV